MSLKDVIGQEKIIQIIKNSLRDKNVFHAYILEGPKGIGKKFTALNFSKAILCENSSDDSCQICNSCKKVETGNHPDLYCIEPDGASIKDAQIEEVQNIMSKKPFEGENTVIIMDHAESMTVRAQNRFLKTLEEPNGNTIVMLLTDNANSLLSTIVSRCIVLKFKPLSNQHIYSYLIDKYGLDTKEAYLLAAFAYGSIGRAEKLHHSEDFQNDRNKSLEIAQKIINKSQEDIFELIDEIDKHKENLADFFDILVSWFRDLTIISINGDQELLINADSISALLQEANRIGYEKAIKVIDIIEEAKKDLSMNINNNLVIKNMLLKIQEVLYG